MTSSFRFAAALLLGAALLAPGARAAAPSVSAGGSHSLAVHVDGTLRSWGDDSAGALGTGRSLQSLVPIQVPGLSGVTAIAAGDAHTVALKSDGTVWTWGRNAEGQLGDGTVNGRSTPAPVPGLTNVVAVAAGSIHTVALKSDGTVWTWGTNYVGQLGRDGNGSLTPQQVPGIANAVAIAAGWVTTFAVLRDGTVWAWGQDDNGQLGTGETAPQYQGIATPKQVVGLTGVVQVAAGVTHTLARRSDGTLAVWGDNSTGNFGNGTTGSSNVPILVPSISNAVYIGAGTYSLVIRSDGSTWAWGSNGDGQIDDSFTDRLGPVRIAGLPAVRSASLSLLHAATVANDGSVWSWGFNDQGALGDGTTNNNRTPVQAQGLANVAAVASGGSHAAALKADGTVWTWGANGAGQLGNGERIFSSTPLAPDAGSGYVAVSAGGRHSLALKSDGTVAASGNNDYGQLGDGTSASHTTFQPVSGLTGVTQVSAGFYHSVARKNDGTVWTWGLDYLGRLGTGPDVPDGLTPAPITTLSNIVSISAGGGHTLALRADGTVWAWGENAYGQLGDGTNTPRYFPVQVPGLTDVVEVAAGADHSLVRKRDGSVWAWGSNYAGHLGDGTTTDRPTPAPVVGLSGATQVSAGNSFSAAVTSDGSVWMWGANYNAQLGDGTFDQQLVPERLSGLTNVAHISAGSNHTLALKADGSVVAWGQNSYGELGDGTLADRVAPVVTVHENGSGGIATNDWFLDLDPGTPTTIPIELLPKFLAVTSGVGGQVVANIHYRPDDVGSSGNVYVFALAPASLVNGADLTKRGEPRLRAKGTPKDGPASCVLAQLSQSGQLQGVSAASLQAYFSGVLSAQGQAVTLLDALTAAQAAGATFFVGYGSSGTAMLANGTNRSVVSLPGATQCQAPRAQTGWWWNPLEDGRGFSLEVHGNNLFFGSFLYDVSGRSTWYISAGPVSLDGSYYTGDLLVASGGQTLGGAYPGFPNLSKVGTVTLAFLDGQHGAMQWPGGDVPIQRFEIIPNGLTLPPKASQPESGWWWNPDESGRGFFMEWQGDWLDVAGFMYDDAGNPVWYLSEGPMSGDGHTYSNTWWSYADGQTLTGTWQHNRQVSNNVAPVTIQFSAPDTALMTLPNGRTTALTRQRF
jgi:alpha-tubulin suppressor-like RCC1 family protein